MLHCNTTQYENITQYRIASYSTIKIAWHTNLEEYPLCIVSDSIPGTLTPHKASGWEGGALEALARKFEVNFAKEWHIRVRARMGE